MIEDIGGASASKRALVSYLTGPLRSNERINFSNPGIARSMVQVLNELDYRVDVVEWSDEVFEPTKPYDLFIGHGGRNAGRIAERLPESCTKIYFSSGCYWKFSNARGQERANALNARRQANLTLDRPVRDEDSALAPCHGIIALGNSFTRSTYRDFPTVLTMPNAAYDDPDYDLTRKDFDAARNNFLFFSGPGNIHKGLDLALEAFAQTPELHLWVCTSLNEPFAQVYKAELFETANIHHLGWLTPRTEAFYSVLGRCNYLIHPSLSEGCPGSVVQAMHYGIFPILSRESGLDVEDGMILPGVEVTDIRTAIKAVAGRGGSYEQAQRIRDFARRDLSEQAFTRVLKSHIETIVAQHRAKEATLGRRFLAAMRRLGRPLGLH